MPAIPPSEFATQLGKLDHEQVVRFVAALWDASGWETRIDGPVVIVSNAERTQRLLVLPPERFPRLSTAPQTEQRIDQVVTPRLVDGESALPRNAPPGPLLDAESLRNRLMYALDRDSADQLATEYLGVSLRRRQWEPDDPRLVQFGQRVSSAVEPDDTQVSRRAALGTLGASAAVGVAWLVSRRTGSADDTGTQDPLSENSTATPETSIPESASFVFDVEEEIVTVTHDGGTAIAAEQLRIQSEGLVVSSEVTWNEVSPLEPADIVSEGDSVTLERSQGFSLTVLIDREDEQEQLASYSQGLTVDSEISFEARPRASFRFDLDTEQNTLTITHQRGQPIRAGELYIQGVGFPRASEYAWAHKPAFGEDSPVRQGASITLAEVRPTVSARVVWKRESDSKILDQFTGPERPRDQSYTGVPSDRYGPRNSGFSSDPGPGKAVGLDWEFEHPRVFGPSAAVQNGKVVVSSGSGTVIALDATDGTQLWRTNMQGSTGGTPTVVDGRVYIRQFTREDSGIVALDLRDGSTLWSVWPSEQQFSQPVVVDGVLYVAATGGPASSVASIYTLDAASGRSIWASNTDKFVFPVSLAVADGRVYTTPADSITALSVAGGSREWEFEAPESLDGAFWGPMRAGDTLVAFYLQNDGSRVYALDPDGTERWHRDLFRLPSTLPVVTTDQLFIPMEGSDLIVLSLDDGTKNWQTFTTNTLTALTAASGTVYAAEDSSLQIIDAETKDSTEITVGRSMRSLVISQDRLFGTGEGVVGMTGGGEG